MYEQKRLSNFLEKRLWINFSEKRSPFAAKFDISTRKFFKLSPLVVFRKLYEGIFLTLLKKVAGGTPYLPSPPCATLLLYYGFRSTQTLENSLEPII